MNDRKSKKQNSTKRLEKQDKKPKYNEQEIKKKVEKKEDKKEERKEVMDNTVNLSLDYKSTNDNKFSLITFAEKENTREIP